MHIFSVLSSVGSFEQLKKFAQDIGRKSSYVWSVNNGLSGNLWKPWMFQVTSVPLNFVVNTVVIQY